jgi:hypothetical protein
VVDRTAKGGPIMNTTSFWDALSGISGSDLAPLIGVTLALVTLVIIVITVTVCKTVYRIQKSRLDDSLKRELIERGLSVDEIERIVRAQPSGNSS